MRREFGPREHGRRSERMADQIRQTLGELLERQVKDPRIGFATITSVELTGDLSIARVFVSILGNEEQKKHAMEGLAAAKNFLRYQLAQHLRLRRTPDIEFHLDRSQEYDERIAELIRRTKRKPEGSASNSE